MGTKKRWKHSQDFRDNNSPVSYNNAHISMGVIISLSWYFCMLNIRGQQDTSYVSFPLPCFQLGEISPKNIEHIHGYQRKRNRNIEGFVSPTVLEVSPTDIKLDGPGAKSECFLHHVILQGHSFHNSDKQSKY